MNIYVAASWRTEAQPYVVQGLRALGHEVYDFREDGFSWRDLDENWQDWNAQSARAMLIHPIAQRGFARDRDALDACDVCVLVLPSGRSAHLELGYAIGKGKTGIVFWPEAVKLEPDLMYALAHWVVVTTAELIEAVEREAITRAAR